MKIISFSPPELKDNYKQMVEILLSKGISNDEVLEKVLFSFVIENDHPIMFAYRLLWEHRYLRRNVCDCSFPVESKTNPTRYTYNVKVSISELIGFFNQIIPPLFVSRVKELYNSIESICDSIRLFLFEDEDASYNTGIFQKCIAWNRFDTSTDYDINRADVIRRNVPDGIACDIEMSTCSIKDIYDGKISYPTDVDDPYAVECLYKKVQFMFSCLRKDDIFDLVDIIHQYNLSILNVFVGKDFYFVEAMTYDYNRSTMPKLQEIVDRSYKPLFE